MTYIRLHNLNKSFKTRNTRSSAVLHVLDNVSLDIERGEFVALVGPSGSGKSTLLRIMGGLISPDSGEVILDGRQITAPDKRIAIVFQQFNLLPWRTALGNIAFGLEMRGQSAREAKPRAMAALKQVGLSGFENYHPAQLSGGMQQRVGLARALAVDPDILLMDEPFGSLDAQTREELQNELISLGGLVPRTVFFVTHDIEEAVFLADRVVVMGRDPGTINAIVPVPFPKPRQQSLRYTPAFSQLRGEIARMLKTESPDVLPNELTNILLDPALG